MVILSQDRVPLILLPVFRDGGNWPLSPSPDSVPEPVDVSSEDETVLESPDDV